MTTIRFSIDEVRISGLSAIDARRLADRFEVELAQLAPQIAAMLTRDPLSPRLQAHIDGGRLPAEHRIERSAAPLAQAVLKALAR
jgi:hypothetical protein